VDPPPALDLQPIHEELPELVTGWQHVWHRQPDRPHLAEAAALAKRLPELPATHLVHCDARDDNFLLTEAGALLCDWNWPVLGPPWLDTVALLISVHGDGGDAEAWIARCELTREVPADQIDVWLAAHTGFMLESADRPVPPTSPYLRAHNAWYAEAGWSWLCRRRGWA
jgi:aminoglycoside phosphotransferase (APT) family kinase protein